jgi:putative nucleotidyltransferase with HDIG domain
MTDPSLEILIVGGDPSLWTTVATAFGQTSTRMLRSVGLTAAALRSAAADSDVIVVAADRGVDPIKPLELCKEVGLQRRTLAIGDEADHRCAAKAVTLGIAGFIVGGSTSEHLVKAITSVAADGVVFDAPAADALEERNVFLHALGPAQMSAAKALASALELKDTNTGGHTERVAALAMRLAEAALIEEALPTEILRAAFLLHDVGKIGIPESILTKPTDLTIAERRLIETHPILGEQIIAPLGLPKVIHQVVRHHHERWDGSGYPDKLSGTAIPAAARLFSIADAIDAMTATRPYRDPLPFAAAVAEVVSGAGSQFDPALTRLAETTFIENSVVLDLN